jgi:hypothetical protein
MKGVAKNSTLLYSPSQSVESATMTTLISVPMATPTSALRVFDPASDRATGAEGGRDGTNARKTISSQLMNGNTKPQATTAGNPASSARRSEKATPIQRNGRLIAASTQISTVPPTADSPSRADSSGNKNSSAESHCPVNASDTADSSTYFSAISATPHAA